MTVFHWLMLAMSICVLSATLLQIAQDDVRNRERRVSKFRIPSLEGILLETGRHPPTGFYVPVHNQF